MELKIFFENTDSPYTVLAELHHLKHLVSFYVYEGDDNYTKEDPFIVGAIKWDGCSNWELPEKQLYFGSQNEARNLGNLFAKLYDWAAELMPHNKEYLGPNKC